MVNFVPRMELTKANKRLVASLATTKGRREHHMFAAEGSKCVLETVNVFETVWLIATRTWLEAHHSSLPGDIVDVTEAKRADIIEMSSLSTPPDVIAVYRIPETAVSRPTAGRLALALDRVQDPGNLGTIIRIASWMGIEDIYCSTDTVDLYNPKVVQATMGAIARVKVCYCDLPQLLSDARKDGVTVYGTFLNGEDIYTATLSDGGVIVMGNEGSGISDEVASTVSKRLFIPPFPPGADCIESLNVSVATAITTAEFRRRLAHNTPSI